MLRSKSARRSRMNAVVDRLKAVYPEATCALMYENDPWKLLVMGRLSAQCTDARVNIVCKELFAKFPDCQSMAEGTIEEIEKIVRPCGLHKTKADSIKRASIMIMEEYNGIIPDSMDELLRLPGVGRKIANLILGDVYGVPAVVCDTHCIRICGRLGFYSESLKDPTKIEFILKDIIAPEEGSDFCHRIVNFGREVCSARSPRCSDCPLADLCDHSLSSRKERK